MMVVLMELPHVGRVGTLLDVIQRATDRANDRAGRWDAWDQNAPQMDGLFDYIEVLDARWDRVHDHYEALIRDSGLTPDEDAVANEAFLEATGAEALTCPVA